MLSDISHTAQLLFGLAVGAAVLYLLLRLFGLKGLLAGLVAIAALLFYRKGREDGRSNHIEKEAEHADEVVREADDARLDARRRDAEPDKLRVDDGFKRKS